MDAMRVDGNVLAGMLDGVFAGDVTVLVGTCRACGSAALIAEAVVEIDATCAIVRCRGCTHTLFTVLRDVDTARVLLGALGELTFRR